MKTLKILIVDDDRNICELLRIYFEREKYDVIQSGNGNDAMNKFKTSNPDIILLDIALPGMDGWQLCKEIRKFSDVPIIMLTAKCEIFDKLLGFEIGADDYITKPFDVKEVVARVKAVARRSGYISKFYDIKEVHHDKLNINLTQYVLTVNGEIIDTPPKEIELLYYLASNPNRVFTRDQLLDAIWGVEYYGDARTVDVHIKRLRTKLSGVSDKWNLGTVWGVGYKFELNEDT